MRSIIENEIFEVSDSTSDVCLCVGSSLLRG